MFSFINFATVIVFLVTMFDDSTQLVTVDRPSVFARPNRRALPRACSPQA